MTISSMTRVSLLALAVLTLTAGGALAATMHLIDGVNFTVNDCNKLHGTISTSNGQQYCRVVHK